MRHGLRMSQTLPLASHSDLSDGVVICDGDNVFDQPTTHCPFIADAGQADQDGDGVGDACEAEAVLNLRAVQDGATTVNLSWVNPAASNLTALRVTYARRDGVGRTLVSDLTSTADLVAGATVRYRAEDLVRGAAYTFTVGGTDIRHGRISQPLPFASVNVSELLFDQDGDGILDGEDNCILTSNQEQTDANDDGYGDACDNDQDDDGFIDIQTPAQLHALRDVPMDAAGQRHELLTDIDLSGYPNWEPIQQYNGTFFDGNDYTISNLNISIGGANPAGLFAKVGAGTTLRNLRLRALRIEGGGSVGALVGISEANISNSHVLVEGAVFSSSNSPCTTDFIVGGLVGDARGGDIINSSATVFGDLSSVASSDNCGLASVVGAAGGLVGRFAGGKIEHSFSIVNGSMSAASHPNLQGYLRPTGEVYVGGLVGQITGAARINGSYARVGGSISTTANHPWAGGLVGRGGSIANSYALVNGDISVERISRFINTVQSRYTLSVGGLIGEAGDRVVNSYVIVDGSVTAPINPPYQHRADINIGPLIGINTVVHSSYYDVMNVNRQPTTSVGASRTLAQLRCPTGTNATCQDAITYTGWDENTWDFGDAQTLPRLRAVRPSPLIRR